MGHAVGEDELNQHSVGQYIKRRLHHQPSFIILLSLIQLLHHLFQQPSIAKEDGKALTQALQHINMDQMFKDNYRTFAFAGLSFIEPMYQRQVHDLPEMWRQSGSMD